MRIIANDVSGSNLTAGSNPALSAFASLNGLTLPRRTSYKSLRGFSLCDPLRVHAAQRSARMDAQKLPFGHQLHCVLHRFFR